MPIWGAIAASLIPIIFSELFGDDDDRDQVYGQQQGMSAAELQEAQRIADQNQKVQDIYQGRYDSAQSSVDSMDLRKIFGDEYAGVMGELLPGKFAHEALGGMMGMTGNVGGGSINASAQRQFLNDQADTLAASGSVNALSMA